MKNLLLLALLLTIPSSVCAEVQDATATGTIRGTVKYVANPQRPWRLGRYYIRNAKTGEIAEAVISLSRPGLKGKEPVKPKSTVVIDQKDFQFTPETVAIRSGDAIRFLNSDNHVHNVKSSHLDHSFNVTMPVGSEHVEEFKTATGINHPYKIDCVFHNAMRAWVFVFDHPWFQVTGADGGFTLENVPAGEYRLEGIHPAGELRAHQIVRVIAGETLTVNLELQFKDAKP